MCVDDFYRRRDKYHAKSTFNHEKTYFSFKNLPMSKKSSNFARREDFVKGLDVFHYVHMQK